MHNFAVPSGKYIFINLITITFIETDDLINIQLKWKLQL